MKIIKFIEIEHELEIDLTADDIFLTFEEDSDVLPVIFRGLSDIAKFLKGIPDKRIQEMTDGQKSIVSDFLLKEAKRYSQGKP